MKQWNRDLMFHDQMIEKRGFVVRDLVLLFNSRLHLFPGKLKSNGRDHSLLLKYSHMECDLENKKGANFTVNGKRIKIYLGHA